MASLIEEVSRRTIDYLASLPSQPAQSTERGKEVAALLAEPPPEQGSSLDSILDLLFDTIIPCAFNTTAPGYFAYVPGGGLHSAAVANYLASAVNRFTGVWAAAPGAAEVEAQSLRWLAELMGFPEGALGVLTTGGSLSNLLATVAAREKLLGDDLSKGTMYFSREAHFSLTKAARVAGIRAQNFRMIALDDDHRMRVDLLEEEIRRDRQRGLSPFFVCGSAGTVDTGVVDPLDAIAKVASREGLWFHVDGAYGGLFRMVPELEPTLAGMEKADSLAVDPHKGLFLAYGTGALLVRNVEDLHSAFSDSASYLPAGEEGGTDFFSLSTELSRDWRGLRVWLPFKLHGVDAFRQALREKRQLAVDARKTLEAEPDVEFAAPLDLSLFAFRQRWQGKSIDEENRLNRALLERINRSRRIMLGGTELDEKFFLRLCVLHLRTHRDRVDEALEIIRESLEAGR